MKKAAQALGKIIVYGGQGALGSACVNQFIAKNWRVCNIDFTPNKKANLNIVVPQTSWQVQEDHIFKILDEVLKGDTVNAIICVTNRWDKGNAEAGLSKQIELMTKRCIWSSTIATALATKYLCPGGLLVLYGSKLALNGTPQFIGYGMVKAAIHHLTISLGHPYAGLPVHSTVLAIVPDTLDTPETRKWMPFSDFKSFTPVGVVAEILEQWISGQDRPESGSLMLFSTRNAHTRVSKITTELREKF